MYSIFEGLVSITCILRPYRLYMMNIKENVILIKIDGFFLPLSIIKSCVAITSTVDSIELFLHESFN